MKKSILLIILILLAGISYYMMFYFVNNIVNANLNESNKHIRRSNINDNIETNKDWNLDPNRNFMTIEELKQSGYTFTTKNPEIDSIIFPNIPNKIWEKPYEILIVYIDCWHSNYPHPDWHPENSSFPLYKLDCDMLTNWKGIREGGMMIDFFMKFYNNPIAKKYIFIHAHDRSWHYKTNVFDRINYIVNTQYFQNRDFGAIFCKYNYFGIDKNDMLNMEGVRPVDDYLKQYNENIKYTIDTQINEQHISPCCSTFFITPEVIKYQKYDFYRILKMHLVDYVIMKSDNNPNDDENFNHNRWAAIWLESMWHQLFNVKRMVYPPKCEVEIVYKEALELINNEE